MIADFLDVLLHYTRCCTVESSDIEPRIALKASKLLSEHYERDSTNITSGLRSVFMELDVEPDRPNHQHTHGKSASVRSTASNLIDSLGELAGQNVEFVQGSSADVRKGRNISRTYYWAKDLAVKPRVADTAGLVAMVDVDYYVDMPMRLVRDQRPHLLYTFQPSQVCRDDGDYRFTFLSDGSVRYNVSGGGEYIHRVWNWDGDSLKVTEYWFGWPYRVATFLIERRHLDDHHSMILVSPLKSYKGFCMAWLAQNFIAARELRRLDPVDGEFTRLRVNTREGLMVSTGLVGGYASCNIPISVDSIIAATKLSLSTNLTLATVKSKLANYDGTTPLSSQGVEVLLAYHRRGTGKSDQVSIDSAVRRYQYVPKGAEADQDAKPGMVAFMKPLYNGAFSPDKCLGNDIRAAEKRVTELKQPDPDLTPFVLKCMKEFVHKFADGMGHLLEPYENEVVYERQNRPTQRRILDLAQHESATDKALVFVKAEAYADANDPRMITTICGPDKMAYSAYVYPVADYMKKMPWYAFGKTPLEIAERVATICVSHQDSWVDITDFSRMDGRVNGVARKFERLLMLKMFGHKYHQELLSLMSTQYCLRAVTRHGHHYDTGLARSSGSPETSAFNSLLTAFVCYMAYRRQSDGLGGYIQMDQAWNCLGIYGGDDGLSGGLGRVNAERSARSVGQVLELERVPSGEVGVKFLARYYGPDVWYGSTNSCCDIRRQLAKFHVTTTLPSNVTPARKLAEKAFAFSLTDRNTPVIGAFVVKALTFYPLTAKNFENLIGAWNVELNVDVQYPNVFEDWMDDLLVKQIPDFDFHLFVEWLSSVDERTIFLPPSLAVAPPPNPRPGRLVVDGDLVLNRPELKTKPPVLQIPRKKQIRHPPKTKKSYSAGVRDEGGHVVRGRKRVRSRSTNRRKPTKPVKSSMPPLIAE